MLACTVTLSVCVSKVADMILCMHGGHIHTYQYCPPLCLLPSPATALHCSSSTSCCQALLALLYPHRVGCRWVHMCTCVYLLYCVSRHIHCTLRMYFLGTYLFNHLICPTHHQTGAEKLLLPPCIMAYLIETLVRCACTQTHTHACTHVQHTHIDPCATPSLHAHTVEICYSSTLPSTSLLVCGK